MKKTLLVVVLGTLFALITSEVISLVKERAEQGDARQNLLEEAEQGDAKAQFILGVMYYSGEKVEKDYAKAIKWIQKAAEQGQREAQTFLEELKRVIRE